MPAAIAIPALIGAAGVGASLYGAKKASDASQTAAAIQTDSANKALDFQKQVYGDQTQRLSPYMQMGTDALARYGLTEQTPFTARVAAAGGSGTQNPYAQSAMGRMGVTPPPSSPYSLQPTGAPPPTSGGPQGQAPPSQPQGQQPQPGGMVTVQDDTGATRQVPAAQAQLYAQRGFQIVANGQGMSGRAPMAAMRN